MCEFRLTQISDTHLARRLQKLTDNFHRVSEHIDATRPSHRQHGDLAFDAPTSPANRNSRRSCTTRCRSAGIFRQSRRRDNPTAVGTARKRPATEQERQKYLVRDRRGPLALRRSRLVLYRAEFADHEFRYRSEAGQFDWLAAELAANGGPVALFLASRVSDAPDEPSGKRRPAMCRGRGARSLIELLSSVDLRLVASGHIHQRRDFTFRRTRHVWAPQTVPDSRKNSA